MSFDLLTEKLCSASTNKQGLLEYLLFSDYKQNEWHYVTLDTLIQTVQDFTDFFSIFKGDWESKSLFNDVTEFKEYKKNNNNNNENSNQKTFCCEKCGSVKKWDANDKWSFAHEQECHNIDLGIPKYGSKLDGLILKFKLCDNCLFDFIHSFISKSFDQSDL